MKQILRGLHTFSGLWFGRVYAIEDPDGLTILDVSISAAPPRILKQLAAAGKQPSDVKRILITHGHPDHIGGLPKLKALTGAQVICSAIERPYVEGTAALPRPTKDKLTGISRLFPAIPEQFMPGTPVDRTLEDEEIMPDVMNGLQALHTPGHAPGHMSFWHPEKRILITGDVIFHLQREMGLPIPLFTVDMDEDRRSIARLVPLEPKVICFGHGQPIMQDAAQKLKAFAQNVGAI